MEENRDEILANFQSITALDVGEAILYLEDANWDLLAAIQRAIPQEDDLGSGPSGAPQSGKFNNLAAASNNNNNSLGEDTHLAGGSSSFNITAAATASHSSSSSGRHRKGSSSNNHNNGSSSSSSSSLNYPVCIHYNGDRHRITLSGHSTVNDLKARVAEKTGVLVCRQSLAGWPRHSKKDAQNGSSTMLSLRLPPETELILTELSSEGSSTSSTSSREFTIFVHFSGDRHRITMSGHNTVNELQARVAEKTGIEVGRQKLGGWPAHSKKDAQNGSSTMLSLSLARETDLNVTECSSEGSSSSTSSRDYTFFVHYNGDRHRITLSGHNTVNDLKARVAEKTGVVVCRQALGGWSTYSKKDAQNGTSTMRSLSLSRETELILTDLSSEGFIMPAAHELDVVGRLNSTFTLNILMEPEGRVFPLKMPGVSTYLDVKTSVYALTNIAARHQAWTGWPRNIADSTTLAQSGVGVEHNFTLKSSFFNTIALDTDDVDEEEENDRVEIDDDDFDDDDIVMQPRPPSGGRRAGSRSRGFGSGFGRNNHMDVFDVDDSEDEIENASDDDLLEDISNMHRSTALMTDNVSDELSGSVMFTDNYQQRYGDAHPQFFTGTLADAIAEATQKPAKDRKLLALYLHHDRSVLTNVFCSQLLGYETIIAELNSNFIVYGWDLTYETNKNMLLSSITSSIGTTASMTVREISVDQLPAMIVVAKLRSSCEVYSVIYGNLGVNDLMVQLLELVERYAEQKSVESRDERERADREAMLMEQDMAYEVSLRADQEKAEEKRRKEQTEANERQRVETERIELEAKKEASRLQAEQTLPEEPSKDYAGPLIKIRVRQPNGQSAERRFLPETKLNILLNYVASIGFHKDEFKMFSGWPRKDLTTMELESTLQDLRLCAQETIILEER